MLYGFKSVIQITAHSPYKDVSGISFSMMVRYNMLIDKAVASENKRIPPLQSLSYFSIPKNIIRLRSDYKLDI